MKRIFLALIFLVLLCSLAVPAAAQSSPFVIDDAALLSSQEEQALERKAAALADTSGMDIVILTVNSLGGKSPEQYADDYYDDHGYGDSGILFLLSMEYRDWYISTCGDAIYALTDYGIQQLGSTAVAYLGQGQYYEAFDAYLDALASSLDSFKNNAPIDGKADYSGDYYHGTQEEVVYHSRPAPTFPSVLPGSLLFGVIAAAVTVLMMRTTMNTKKKQHHAGAYLNRGSFKLSLRQDLFLYSNVKKIRRPDPPSTGGSSVHHSSSGRSHGGGGGKF